MHETRKEASQVVLVVISSTSVPRVLEGRFSVGGHWHSITSVGFAREMTVEITASRPLIVERKDGTRHARYKVPLGLISATMVLIVWVIRQL